METYSVRLPNGRTVSRQLAPGLKDAQVQAAFLPDYRKAGFKTTGPVINGPSNEQYWRKKLGNQGSISTATPGLGERLQGYLSDGLRALGVENYDANRLGSKWFSAVNDLTPLGNATGMDEGARTARAGFTQGDLGKLALGSGIFALSAFPGASGAKRLGGGMFGRLLRDESGAIRAWHGSPHDFDKFSLSKIGTGEGAQGQGHGLYFAGDKNSAKWYADTYGNGNGNLYQVSINANPRDMLDWNLNLGDMPKPTKDRVRAAIPNAAWDENGMALYGRANQIYGSPEAASKALRDVGVPGVRYQGQKGTNYSVFDDSLIEILNKF